MAVKDLEETLDLDLMAGVVSVADFPCVVLTNSNSQESVYVSS